MYDPEDFKRDPGKYKRFSSARIAVPILSAPDLKVGALVAIEYHQTRINPGKGGLEMPIYKVVMQDDEQDKWDHYLFACALTDYR